MKKFLSIIICAVFLLGVFSFSALAEKGSFSSLNKEAAIGSSFTTSYTVGSGKIAQAFIRVSTPSQLELTSVSAAASGWNCNKQNGGYYLIPTDSKDIIKGSSPLVTLTFKVLETAAAGSSASVSLSGSTSPTVGSDSNTAEGNQDISGSFSIKIIQNPQNAQTQTSSTPKGPMLSALSIENAKISPEFNPKNFVYDVTVPYEVEKLNVTATPQDASCKVTVDDTPLSDTEVTSIAVRLRSATGTSMYNLRVTREARQKNSNNKLLSISAEGFLLSPAFSKNVTEYVIWVPFETTSVNISATPESEYSAVTVTGGEELKTGEFNKVTVACTSESGLINEYYISVYRAAEGEGLNTVGTDNDTSQEQENTLQENGTDEKPSKTKKSSQPLAFLLGVLTGAATGLVIYIALVKGWLKKLLTPHSEKTNDIFLADSDITPTENGNQPNDCPAGEQDDLFESSDN